MPRAVFLPCPDPDSPEVTRCTGCTLPADACYRLGCPYYRGPRLVKRVQDAARYIVKRDMRKAMEEVG